MASKLWQMQAILSAKSLANWSHWDTELFSSPAWGARGSKPFNSQKTTPLDISLDTMLAKKRSFLHCHLCHQIGPKRGSAMLYLYYTHHVFSTCIALVSAVQFHYPQLPRKPEIHHCSTARQKSLRNVTAIAPAIPCSKGDLVDELLAPAAGHSSRVIEGSQSHHEPLIANHTNCFPTIAEVRSQNS